jgi:tetratricopeptide (TPR) repeat protein
MQELINKHINDPKNDIICFNLGYEYEKIGHTASALSYYLKAAEFTFDNKVAYEALLRAGKCLNTQGRRTKSEKGLYLQAVALLPKRPEAYLILSQFSESYKEWIECNMWASTGLANCTAGYHTMTDLGYKGSWSFIFQQAVSSWWMGRGAESKRLFTILKTEYSSDMTPEHTQLVNSNIAMLQEKALNKKK